jgi:hypothetical protein
MSPSSGAKTRLERAVDLALASCDLVWFESSSERERQKFFETFLNYFVDVTLGEVARESPAFLLIRTVVSRRVKEFWRGPAT